MATSSLGQWDLAAQRDFWSAYSRLRSPRTRVKLALPQMRAIFAGLPDAAIQIGRCVADDLSSVPKEHARFLSELATMMLKAGDADEAVDTALLAAQTERLSRGSTYITNPPAATMMVDVFADSDRPERADDVLETLDFLDHGSDDDNETTIAYRQVLRAGVLALCDRSLNRSPVTPTRRVRSAPNPTSFGTHSTRAFMA